MSERPGNSLWALSDLLCVLVGTLDAGEAVPNATASDLLQVTDFGAIGNGVHDDAPAIAAARKSDCTFETVYSRSECSLTEETGQLL